MEIQEEKIFYTRKIYDIITLVSQEIYINHNNIRKDDKYE